MVQQSRREGVIEGDLVRLRPAGQKDLDLLAAWFGDPDFIDHWAEAPLSRDEVAAKYVGRRRPDVESFIVLAARGPLGPVDQRAEVPIGYAQYWHAGAAVGGLDLILARSARGRGYGPDAAKALTHFLLHCLKWSQVTVDPAADNPRAIRAWEKAGFERVSKNGGEILMERRS
jgi:aminoglycoside 6'-N-acetyltransferase